MAELTMSGDTKNSNETFAEIALHGKTAKVPSACINGQTVIVTGRWLKIAAVMDEELQDCETIADPDSVVGKVNAAGLKADIFTFSQKLPESIPRYPYRMELDNFAAIPIISYSEWLGKKVSYGERKAVKRAAKLGVEVRRVDFDDAFVRGISNIYNETPVRQNRKFWHYQKDFETVKRENSTYLDRSVFIGAYFQGELIGFIRMVRAGRCAMAVQVISQIEHREKKPTNALIAKVVEICEQEGLSHFVYGHYIYSNSSNSLTDFKRRNGFEQILLPRYYIPITRKGAIALRLGLHHSLVDRIPLPLRTFLVNIKRKWFSERSQLEPGRPQSDKEQCQE